MPHLTHHRRTRCFPLSRQLQDTQCPRRTQEATDKEDDVEDGLHGRSVASNPCPAHAKQWRRPICSPQGSQPQQLEGWLHGRAGLAGAGTLVNFVRVSIPGSSRLSMAGLAACSHVQEGERRTTNTKPTSSCQTQAVMAPLSSTHLSSPTAVSATARGRHGTRSRQSALRSTQHAARRGDD